MDKLGSMSKDGASSSSTKRKSRRPKYSKFTQQELSACKPILTPGWVISIFVTIGIIFIPIGFASLFASERVIYLIVLYVVLIVKFNQWPLLNFTMKLKFAFFYMQVVEIVDHYDKDCVPLRYTDDKLAFIQNSKTNKTCIRRLTVPKQMKSPVYIYYQLDHFYQNHRRYVKSRSDSQLRSKSDENTTTNCAPERISPNGAIVPCGLIAWSLFNDTYKFSVKNKQLGVNKKDITWKSDQGNKFGSDVYPKNFQSGGLIGGAKLNSSIPLSEQEDLIVWMRTAALPTFRKLYGRIEVDLEANDVVIVTIENNYNTYSFGGNKKLVLSTASWIGGKNYLLGVAYLTVGGLCLFLAISFILLYLIKPRPLGDTSYLSWNRSASGGHIFTS